MRTLSAGALLYLVAVGCSRDGESRGAVPPAPATSPAVQEETVTSKQEPVRPAPADARRQFAGTLRGGVMAIGAETTGWALETDDAGRVDVDASKVAEAARALDGKRVVIEGAMVTANWIERGEKQLLVAESISPADGRGGKD